MSIAQGLQIHSNVSVPMDPEPTVETNEEEGEEYIGRQHWRRFLLGSTITLLVLHAIVLAAAGCFMYFKKKVFKSFFMNYAGLGNGYDIASTILLFLSFILLSIAPKFGRKAKKLLFLLIIFLSVTYLSFFLLRLGSKKRHGYNFGEYILPFYGMFFTATLGLLINVIAAKDRLKTQLGIAISVCLFTIYFVFLLVMKRFSPKIWQDLLYIFGAYLLATYLNKDAQLMTRKRDDFYLKNDWFLGFVHLQTDFTFRFWYDLFVTKKPRDEEDVVLEGGAEPDMVDSSGPKHDGSFISRNTNSSM